MIPETTLSFLALVGSLITCGIVVSTYVRGGVWRDKDDSARLWGAIDQLGVRVTRIEQALEALPTASLIHEMREALAEMRASTQSELKHIQKDVEAAIDGVRRIESHLMHNKAP